MNLNNEAQFLNDTKMFIFVLLIIGFIIWGCSSDKSGQQNTQTTQRPTARTASTSARTVIKTPNYSRPQTTVGVVKRMHNAVETKNTTVRIASTPTDSSDRRIQAIYVPRTRLSFDNIPNKVLGPQPLSISKRPAVSEVKTSSISSNKIKTANIKTEHEEILRILNENGVVYLYHFTDRRNLESIRRNGGLFSWQSCMSKGIQIPYAGGDANSRLLDSRYGLQDYVRLSLCNDHPMMWRLKQNGYDLVLLKIKIDAALLRDTLYSDMNATDVQHSHGSTLQDLKKIRFSATKRRYVRRDDADFKYHQAEMMVKTFIPAEYIVNLDNPQAA